MLILVCIGGLALAIWLCRNLRRDPDPNDFRHITGARPWWGQR